MECEPPTEYILCMPYVNCNNQQRYPLPWEGVSDFDIYVSTVLSFQDSKEVSEVIFNIMAQVFKITIHLRNLLDHVRTLHN